MKSAIPVCLDAPPRNKIWRSDYHLCAASLHPVNQFNPVKCRPYFYKKSRQNVNHIYGHYWACAGVGGGVECAISAPIATPAVAFGVRRKAKLPDFLSRVLSRGDDSSGAKIPSEDNVSGIGRLKRRLGVRQTSVGSRNPRFPRLSLASGVIVLINRRLPLEWMYRNSFFSRYEKSHPTPVAHPALILATPFTAKWCRI